MHRCFGCNFEIRLPDYECFKCRSPYCNICGPNHVFWLGDHTQCYNCSILASQSIRGDLLFQHALKRLKMTRKDLENDFMITDKFKEIKSCQNCTVCANKTCLHLEHMHDDPAESKLLRCGVCCLCGNTREACKPCLASVCIPAVVGLKQAGLPRDLRMLILSRVKKYYE